MPDATVTGDPLLDHRCHSGWRDPPHPAYDLTPGGDGKTQLYCPRPERPRTRSQLPLAESTTSVEGRRHRLTALKFRESSY
jgi:hypothetical protein